MPSAAVATAPGLALTSTVKSTSVVSGESIEYTIRWRCASITDDCTEMSVVATLPTLPSGVSLIAKSGTGGLVTSATVAGGVITWTLKDPVSAGSTGQLKFILTSGCVEAGQPAAVVAPINARVTATNAVPAIVAAPPTPAVTIRATMPLGSCTSPPPTSASKHGPDFFAPGGAVKWWFEMSGHHEITDTLPDYVELENFNLADWPTNGAASVSCDGGTTWSPWYQHMQLVPASVTPTVVIGSHAGAVDASWVNGTGGCNRVVSAHSGNYILQGSANPQFRFNAYSFAEAGGYGFSHFGIEARAVPTIPAGVKLTNCALIDATQACHTSTQTAGPIPSIRKNLVATPENAPAYYAAQILDGNIQGPADLIYEVSFNNFQSASADLVNPVITDLLPIELDYVPAAEGGTNFFSMRWSGVGWVWDQQTALGGYAQLDPFEDPAEQPGCSNPAFSVERNWNGSGRTMLTWRFDNCRLPHGKFTRGFDNFTGVIYVSARLKPGVPVGTEVWNNSGLTTDNRVVRSSVEGCIGTFKAYDQAYDRLLVSDPDSGDRDGDGDLAERVCGSNGVRYTMPELVTMESSKWVHGSEDGDGWSRYPNVGIASTRQGQADYHLFMDNQGNVKSKAIDIVDVLPNNSLDTMVSDGGIRRGFGGIGSEWGQKLTAPISVSVLDRSLTVPGHARAQDYTAATPLVPGVDYDVYYSTQTNPCRMDSAGQVHIIGTTNVGVVPPTAPSPYTSVTVNQPPGCVAPNWILNPATVTAADGFRSYGVRVNREINSPTTGNEHGDIVRLQVTADATAIPASANGKIAWNSFAYTMWTKPLNPVVAPAEMLSTEPLQVGVKLIDLDLAASLGDYVWIDADHDGGQDSGELGVDGVTVRLYRDANADGVPDSPTPLDVYLTSDNPHLAGAQPGYYHFAGLAPTTAYVVRLDNSADFNGSGPLARFELTRRDASADDAIDSDATTWGNASFAISPTIAATTGAATTDTPTYDFGFWGGAALGNLVWFDDDRDGYQGASELPVSGVRVRLLQPGPDGLAGTADDVEVIAGPDGRLGTADDAPGGVLTGSDGQYRFENLFPGDFFVVFDRASLPVGYVFTSSNLIDDVGDSDPDRVSGRTIVTTLGLAERDMTWDAGISHPPAVAAELGNYAWIDADFDGLQDPGESPLPGVVVDLIDANNMVIDSIVTDSGGRYWFGSLLPGAYSVQFTPPMGYKLTKPSAVGSTPGTAPNGSPTDDSDVDPATGATAVTVLVDNESDPTWDAGFVSLFSIGNAVWADNNDNGRFDADEVGLDGVSVRLFAAGGVEVRVGPDGQLGTADDTAGGVLTSNAGHYLFTGLAAGSYYVEVIAPLGYESAVGNGHDLVRSGPYESPAVDQDTTVVDGDDNGSTVGATIRSATVDVAFNTEPVAEPPTPGWPDDAGDGNGNYQVDFGLVRTLELGNLVWFDANVDGDFDADGTEPVVAGAMVRLYETDAAGTIVDRNGDAIVDNRDALATDTTDGTGFYLFTGLLGGTYLVEVDNRTALVAGSANPLAGRRSTVDTVNSPAPNSGPDRDDNGITQTLTGIRSAPAVLAYAMAPTAEFDAPTSTGDADSNLAVDFGFLPVHDLALRKRLVSFDGSVAKFLIEVLNQGSSVGQVDITDYIDPALWQPFDPTLNPGGLSGGSLDAGYSTPAVVPTFVWAAAADPVVTITGTIGADEAVSVPVTLRLKVGLSPLPGRVVNVAEISEFRSGSGVVLVDIDSTLDRDRVNDGGGQPGGLSDDAIDGDGSGVPGSGSASTDEDDSDPAALPLYDLALTKGLSVGQSAVLTVPPAPPRVSFDITVINQGSTDAYFVEVTDTPPTGMSFVSVAGASGSSPTFSVPYLAAGASMRFTVVYQVDETSSGDFTNVAEISSFANDADPATATPPYVVDVDSTPDSNPTNDAGGAAGTPADSAVGGDGSGAPGDGVAATDEDDADPARVTLPYDLALRKRVDPADPDVADGIQLVPTPDKVTFFLEIFNQGRDVASIDVTDYVPAGSGWSFVPADNPSGTAAAGSAGAPTTLPTYSWTTTDGTKPVVTLVGTVEGGRSVVVPVVLTASAPVPAGDMKNTAEITEFRDDAGAPLTDADSTPDSTDGDTSVDDVIDSTPSNPPGGRPADEDDHDVAFTAWWDLSLVNVASTFVMDANSPSATFTVTVKNQGTRPVFNAAVRDTIPAGTSVASTSPGVGTTCAPATPGGVTCTIVTLAAGATATFQLTLNIDDLSIGTYENIAEVTRMEGDTNVVAGDTVRAPVSDIDSVMDTDPANDALFANSADPFGYPRNSHNQIDFVQGVTSVNAPNLLDEDDHDAQTVIVPLAIGDQVWFDGNRNGIHEPNEQPVAGAGVVLLMADPADAGAFVPAIDATGVAVPTTVVTNARGWYVFDNLVPGRYQVRFTHRQTGWLWTVADAPTASTDAVDSDARFATTGDAVATTASFVLAPNQANVTVVTAADRAELGALKAAIIDRTRDAGIWLPLAIGNLVWYDNDHDGQQGLGESAVAGVTVELLDASGNAARDANGALVGAVATGADGRYRFDNLVAGDYRVKFSTLPAGYRPTAQAGGGDRLLDSNPDAGGLSAVFALSAVSDTVRPTVAADGTSVAVMIDPSIDAGVWMPLAVGNFVWDDANHNGIQDAGEPGVAGVGIELRRPDGTVIATATTDASGAYLFDNLGSGDYQIRFLDYPPGYLPTIQGVAGSTGANDSNSNPADGLTPVFTLVAGGTDLRSVVAADGTLNAVQINPTIDAGLWRAASIGDLVWFDDNRNGTQDAGEPGVPSVTVSLLDGTGTVIATTITDASGRYEFTGLVPDHYQIRFELATLPTGVMVTGADLGDDLIDSDVDPATGLAPPTNLTALEHDPSFDLGILRRSYDLVITKRVAKIDAAAATIAWTITVKNNGPDPAAGPIIITDDLIDQLSFVRGGNAQISCVVDRQRVTCITGSFDVGAEITIEIVTNYTGAVGGITNTASVRVPEGSRPELTTSNNSSTVTVARGTIPATGLDATPMVVVGGLLVAFGYTLVTLVSLAGARRRRPAR